MQKANSLVTDQLIFDPASSVPLHRQLYQQFRRLILEGALHRGELLPPTRQLSKEIGFSRNTVLAAYEQLQAEGLVDSQRGAGTRVVDIESEPLKANSQGSAALTRAPARRLNTLPPTPPSGYQLGGDALLPGFPDPREFPSKTWNRLSNRANRHLASLLPELDLYSGYTPLRQVLAQYLKLSRGVFASPAQIFITAGASQSLLLITRALADVGDTVWLEDPAYHVAKLAFELADLNIAPVAVDRQGINPEVVPSRAPKLIYLTASYQYPLGFTMPIKRRLQWLEKAQHHNAWLIEDDYDGEFRYHGSPIPALAGLQDNQRTLYLGTFSKVLSPTLRMSYLVVPPGLVDTFRQVYPMLGNESSIVTQATLAELISAGHFAKHIKRMRNLYGERREALEQALSHYGGLLCSQKLIPGGLHIPVGVDTNDQVLAHDIIKSRLGCIPLSALYHSERSQQGLLLGFTSRDNESITTAVRGLVRILQRRKRAMHIIEP